ncbi:hypothetical protein [Paenibacillus sp. Marseille-Q4541]|uniref:hypothetical protein n=1 Tax=Paenibacillus sp. Marseille-Q4541 TaxID=2831522 RepID=UPI001BA67C51|nr:hypothetical protein [Paenibacillus sp. Marseille-Q4541]
MKMKKELRELTTRNRITKIGLLLLIAMLSLTLAACGQDANETSGQASIPGTSSGSSGTSVEPTEPDTEVKEGSGVYTGQADPHTIEITINGQATAFQLGEGMDTEIANLEEQTPVDFTYEEKAIEGEADLKQLILLSIKPSVSK